MKRTLSIATASVAAMLLALTVSVTAQDISQRRTFLTFSAPVEMPGVTLPAGTYVFKIADTASRDVVQVFDKDEKDILGQWLYVPSQRQQATDETVITFKENREGTTPAVQFWYYPGERAGREFIYPKEQALRIAARTGAAVRVEDGVVEGSGVPQAEATVAVAEPAPAAAPAESSAVGTSGRSEAPAAAGTSGIADQSADNNNVRQESTTASNNAELPRTASPLPLSGLLGFLSLAGAVGLRRFRRQ